MFINMLYLLLVCVLLNSSTCDGQMFGFNNSYTCHCQNNGMCHLENGNCLSESCQPGWSGTSCQKRNVALHKPANQSGQENEQGPWFATDNSRANEYDDCIDTNFSPWAWWLVDLQQTYLIRYITIYYRSRRLYKFKGFSLSTIDTALDSTLCFRHTSDVELTSPYTIRCNSEGRYINISNNKPEDGTNYLSLCEVEVYVCSVGTYGRDCEQFCHCSGYSRCHVVSGTCSNGCLDGWHDSSCNASCSTINAYGPGCMNSCITRHCNGSVACDHVTGNCVDGCEAGYLGSECTQECLNGFYGDRCNESCSNRHCLIESSECNHVNGTCVEGCSAGYTSPDCTHECLNGFYGDRCIEACSSRHCLIESSECNHVNGTCPEGCTTGYTSIDCTQSCSTINAYGPGCMNSCITRHCNGSVACDHVTGHCVDGCEAGYLGSDCTQECHNGFYGDRCREACSNRHCLEESSECNHVNGTCLEGCSAGYASADCTQECQGGFYGLSCQSNCSERFCLHMSSSCANVIGACEGGCLADYIGSDCTTKLGNQNNSVAIATTVTVVILLAGIAFVVYWRRHRSTKNTVTNNPQIGLVPRLPEWNEGENEENMYVNVAIISNRGVQISPPNSKSNHKSTKFVNGDDDNTDDDETLSNECSQEELEDTEYSNLPSSKSELTPDELEQYVDTMKSTQGFTSLYAGLHSDWTATYNEAQVAENRPKNRYKGYYPYDHSRVILQKLQQDQHSDFINANYIDGYFRKKKYIAAQGATSVTLNDFIRMIWENKCDKIIMLTNVFEMAKLKCDRYWPEQGSERFGSILLTLQEEKVRADFTIRYIKMTKDKLIHHFCQFHYTSWPDHGVPDTGDLLDFLFTVNRYKPTSTKPEIIHCSAGVGRTGTYIAVDYCLKQGEKTGKVGVLDLVKTIRNQRKGLIQTAHQLEFVFQALIDGLKHGDTSISKALFESSDTGRFSQHAQWEYLSSIETGNKERMNRSITDNGFPVCRFPSRTNVNGYFVEEMQGLDAQSVWEIIMDQHQTSIVLFIIDNTNEISICPHFGSQETHGDLVLIKTEDKKISEGLNMISVTVSRPEIEEETEVKLFVFHIDQSGGKYFKTATNNMLQLIDQLDKHQNNQNSITLFSSDPTGGRLFCSLRNIVQRLQLDDEVEIFSVIKKMHEQIGKTIKSQDEYRQIHQCISDYIKSYDTYINL